MSYTCTRAPAHLHVISTAFDTWMASSSMTSTITPTADLAVYVPVRVYRRVIVRKLVIANGYAVDGNIDIGVYDTNGTRLVSTGNTAQSGTSTLQKIDVTDTTIGPGVYYFALTTSSASAKILGASGLTAPVAAAEGMLQEQLGTGVALPSTATWVVPTSSNRYMPIIGALIAVTVVS